MRRERIVFLECSGEGGKHLRLNSRGARRGHGGTAFHCEQADGTATANQAKHCDSFGIIGITKTERFIIFAAKKKWQ